jgi:leader peptidase (prepilin peptidase)/N-methyltransferase
MTELLPWWFTTAFLAVLGALVGSFLNVVVWRVPQGLSIVRPPSACPNCHHEIAWYDNIPIVSWLVLRGKCRTCAAPISIRYPLVEGATAVAFGVVGWAAYAGWYPEALLPALLYWAAVGIALTLIDLDHHRLPNVIVLPSYIVTAALLTLASVLTVDYGRLLTAAIGCAALFALYWILAMAYPGGMGFGDVKLAGALGMLLGWLGWAPLIVGGFSAFLIGGLIGAILMIGRRATRKSSIPFGPFMLVGAAVGIFAGVGIAELYLTATGIA